MNIITNPAELEQIRKAMQEISESLTRQEGEKALIKEIKQDLHEAFKDKLTKKTINQMAKIYHNGTFKSEVAASEELQLQYQNIFGIVED